MDSFKPGSTFYTQNSTQINPFKSTSFNSNFQNPKASTSNTTYISKKPKRPQTSNIYKPGFTKKLTKERKRVTINLDKNSTEISTSSITYPRKILRPSSAFNTIQESKGPQEEDGEFYSRFDIKSAKSITEDHESKPGSSQVSKRHSILALKPALKSVKLTPQKKKPKEKIYRMKKKIVRGATRRNIPAVSSSLNLKRERVKIFKGGAMSFLTNNSMNLDPQTEDRLRQYRNSYGVKSIKERKQNLHKLRVLMHKNRRIHSADPRKRSPKFLVNLQNYQKEYKMDRSNLSQDSLYKMIWKTLLYLIDKKSLQIEELLIKDIKGVLGFIKEMINKDSKGKVDESKSDVSGEISLDSQEQDEQHYLNEEQFYALLDKLRLNDDKNFSKKFFTLFCFSGKGRVNYYELFQRIFQFCLIKKCDLLQSGRKKSKKKKRLKFLRKTTTYTSGFGKNIDILLQKGPSQDKITKEFNDMFDRYFELCDEDDSGTIDKKEFYTLLRLNVNDYKDRNLLKDCINDIYHNHPTKKGESVVELSKDEFKTVLMHNKIIRSLIDKTLKIIKTLTKMIEADLEKMFQNTLGIDQKESNLPIQPLPTTNSNGTMHQDFEKLYCALKEIEQIHFKNKRYYKALKD
ncbi:unnamed protein product [Moneuplotes crassus]|uniref:EF-hand domain-containing protein n=1 Tax=Euplotes crassus TaxID=5936 RepID=A0AAD1XWP7_EUPCR|nr:unnamed protein product [Moneuplotes crassus]